MFRVILVVEGIKPRGMHAGFFYSVVFSQEVMALVAS